MNIKKKLYLNEDTKVKITFRNPMFHSQGTASMPFTLPGANKLKLKHPHSPNKNALTEFDAAIKFNGNKIIDGKLVIGETDKDNYQYHFEAGKGAFAAAVKDVYITDIEESEIISDNPPYTDERIIDITNYTEFYPNKNLVFFPVYMPEFDTDTESYPDTDVLNAWDAENQKFKTLDRTYYNGEFQHSPQYYLCYVIEKVFNYLGYNVIENAIYENSELRQSVLFNFNPDWRITDSTNIFYYEVSFKKDLPHILIAEFITGIENYLGVKFFINDIAKNVKIKFLSDVVTDSVYKNYTDKSSKEFVINHDKIKGVTLSTNTSEKYISDNTAETIEIIDEVEKYSDLPTSPLNNGDKYLVVSENVVYQWGVTEENPLAGWSFYSLNFLDYIISDGSEPIDSELGTLAMYNTDKDDCNSIPRCDEERVLFNLKPTYKRDESKNIFKILIFRGLIECIYNPVLDYVVETIAERDLLFPSNGELCYVKNNEIIYDWNLTGGPGIGYWDTTFNNFYDAIKKVPLATSGVYYLNQDNIYTKLPGANISLIYQTDNGLIEMLWKEYLVWLLNWSSNVTRYIDFDSGDLNQLDFSEKIRVENLNYFISSIDVLFERGKMVVEGCELVRC